MSGTVGTVTRQTRSRPAGRSRSNGNSVNQRPGDLCDGSAGAIDVIGHIAIGRHVVVAARAGAYDEQRVIEGVVRCRAVVDEGHISGRHVVVDRFGAVLPAPPGEILPAAAGKLAPWIA